MIKLGKSLLLCALLASAGAHATVVPAAKPAAPALKVVAKSIGQAVAKVTGTKAALSLNGLKPATVAFGAKGIKPVISGNGLKPATVAFGPKGARILNGLKPATVAFGPKGARILNGLKPATVAFGPKGARILNGLKPATVAFGPKGARILNGLKPASVAKRPVVQEQVAAAKTRPAGLSTIEIKRAEERNRRFPCGFSAID